jgi:hypothetical protein
VRSLSEGFRVQASVLARLLGLKLLKLDATVTVLPAGAREAPSRSTSFVVPAGPDRREAVVGRNSAGDQRLADAIRNLDEGARLLEEVRQSSSAQTRTRA